MIKAGRSDAFASAGMRTALSFFAVGVLLSVIAVNFQLGSIPIRAIFIALAAVTIFLVSPTNSVEAIIQNRKPLSLIGLSAIIGIIVSFANGGDGTAIFRQLLEIHVQAVVGLILATLLIRNMGLKLIALVFLICWGLSAGFSAAQFLGIDLAWQVRGFLGGLMEDPEITRRFYEQKQRALGLSFTPVHLATQTCLAFAAFFALRIYATSGAALRRIDGPICIALGLVILVCVLSGNRSPLIGFTAFLTIYVLVVTPRLFVISLPFAMLASLGGLALFGMMQEAGLRIASLEDGSAIGRATLVRFGIQLLWEQPLGYGLLFESTDFADHFAHQAIHLNNPDIIRHFSLHNYYLQMLNKYGILILALIPLLIPKSRLMSWAWMAFVPYLIHIAFHNDGPLSSDFLFWFVLPLFPAALAAIPKSPANQNRPRRWTRSYRRMNNPISISSIRTIQS